MPRPIYRRGKGYARQVKDLLYHAKHPEWDRELDPYRQALAAAVREQLTHRELECMCAYYLCSQSMAQSARMLEVNPSTVSRCVRRGEEKLDQLVKLAKEISPIKFQ